MPQLANKRCLIAGGTTGIGRAAAQRFLEEGATVVIAGRAKEKGTAACKELAEVGRVHFVPCDVSDPKQVQDLFLQALEFLGGVDVLYHVAGISGRKFGDGPLHECTDAGWQATMDANLKSTFLTNRAAVRCALANGK